MRIAYIISVYKLPEQLIRLVKRLNTPTTLFYIHVDKKADDHITQHIQRALGGLDNVHFLKQHVCHWGGFGHVQGTLEGIDQLCQIEADFDYAILLTGQDYPIKANDEITAFLRQHNGSQFMEYFPLPSDNWEYQGLDRIQRWHVRLAGRRFAFPPRRFMPIKRALPGGLQPFGGSSYWCLSRDCIEYVFTFTRQNPALVNFFRYVEAPDEIFFQTILLNSPFKARVINDNLRYIEWKDANSGSPAILGKGDFDAMMASSKLFARKFDVTVDAEILDWIDARITPAIQGAAV